jgi:hypothetical protein
VRTHRTVAVTFEPDEMSMRAISSARIKIAAAKRDIRKVSSS